VEVHVSSDEESEAEKKEEDESEGGFVTERKEPVIPVPRWEVLAEHAAAREQLYKQLGLEGGSFGSFRLVVLC
jgi:hypothetical protein